MQDLKLKSATSLPVKQRCGSGDVIQTTRAKARKRSLGLFTMVMDQQHS